MQGAKPLAGKKIAIMVASGFIEEHMTDVQKSLIAAGAQSTIISPEVGVANGWHEGGWGHNFFVDEKISDVLPVGRAVTVAHKPKNISSGELAEG